MARVFRLLLVFHVLLLSAFAQQGIVNQALLDTAQAGSGGSSSASPSSASSPSQGVYVNRWDVFTGYSFLTAPTVNLNQNGFNGSFGANLNRWLGLGIDFSYFGGSENLHLNDTILQGQITSALNSCTTQPCFPAPLILPIVDALYAPTSVRTTTLAGGPQFNVRRVKESTLFLRPGGGMIHESAKINVTSLNGQIASLCATPTGMFFCSSPEGMGILNSLGTAVKPNMTDTVGFYGVGGGIDVNVSRRVGVRFSTDYVRAHLFSNLLPSQNIVRFSIGPTWRFGDISRGK